MYRLNQVKLNICHSDRDLKNKLAKSIGVSVEDIDWSTLKILHKAIDARDKGNILFVYNVAFNFVDDNHTVCDEGVGAKYREPARKLEKYEPIIFNPIVEIDDNANHIVRDAIARPLVVGFGPAGIFASYILALNGLRPIIVERGKSLDDRTKDVNKFFETLELDENSNVCFGEGGAGAFSDGKLNTNNKDKTGIYHFVLETFAKFGADEKILYENLPHIGTDKLVDVIKNIRNEILKLGGEIHYNTKLVFKDGMAEIVHMSEGSVGVCSNNVDLVVRDDGGSQSFAPTDATVAPTGDDGGLKTFSYAITKDTPVILAIGNSSRDTFRELIENGFDVKAKSIAVGYRIAHRQSFINELQYGRRTACPYESSKRVSPLDVLGPATYKLTYNVGNGHSVYSFCMCPGGYIINSSNFKNMLAINGMSYNDRSGKYANSAIVETIRPEDIGVVPTGGADALKMIEFQEKVERKAYELEKGFIPYVTSGGSDICSEDVFKGQAKYCEKLKSVYEECGIAFDINKDIEEALKYFNKKIPGFFGDNIVARNEVGSQSFVPTDAAVATTEYVIAGVETRTSSPVKLDRDENCMCNVPNFYPCGEGLGHGGGIMSCAVDGIIVACSVIKQFKIQNMD